MKFKMIPKKEFSKWYTEMTKRVDKRLEEEILLRSVSQ